MSDPNHDAVVERIIEALTEEFGRKPTKEEIEKALERID